MKPIALSPRLEAVKAFVPQGAVAADIGADHGQLILSLCENGIISTGYACENKPGPFARLQAAIANSPYREQITAELADGLTHLPETADTVVIAGMGGELLVSILNRSPKRLKTVKTLILAPNTDVPEVRKAVNRLGFAIKDEIMIAEKKRDHEILLAVRGPQTLNPLDILYGPCLRKARSSAFIAHQQKRLMAIEALLTQKLSMKRRSELLLEKERLESL